MIPLEYLETLGVVATVIAVLGVVLMNYKRRACHLVYCVSNLLFVAVHLSTDPPLVSMVGRDLVFLGLAVAGWYQWRTPRTYRRHNPNWTIDREDLE
jgi:nicotinamide riboside transporter PnuC